MDYTKVDLIPLIKIKVEKYNVRLHGIDDGIEDLAASIKAVGLLQPITAYFASEDELYVILAGQRRLNAYYYLDENYPNQGFDKIKCIVIDEPQTNEAKMSLSLAENITQVQMHNSDLVKAVTDLFNVYRDYEMVREKFGLTKYMIDKYVRLARLPDRLKKAISEGEISPNDKKSENAAIRAVDALRWVKNGNVSDEAVLELAVQYAKNDIDDSALDDAARGETDVGTIIKNAKENKRVKKNLSVDLTTEIAKKLGKVAESKGESENTSASRYIIEGVTKDYTELED